METNFFLKFVELVKLFSRDGALVIYSDPISFRSLLVMSEIYILVKNI